jgi:hypothetical protein
MTCNPFVEELIHVTPACVFDGLAYLSNYYNYGLNNSCDYYYGSFSGSYSGDFMYDPSGNLMGITATHTYEFASSYFYTQQLSNGTDIYHFFQQGGGSRVLTSMDITSGSGVTQAHAIILECQNSNGSYRAWDATESMYRDVPADQINTAMLIGICGE